MPPKTVKSPVENEPKNKTKRCPKGEFRNKKTGLCEKKVKDVEAAVEPKATVEPKTTVEPKAAIQLEPKANPNIEKQMSIYEKRVKCIQNFRKKIDSQKRSKTVKKLPAVKMSEPTKTLQFHSKSALISKSKLFPKGKNPFHRDTALRDLSNFSEFDVEYDGVVYKTVEHAFQTLKSLCMKGPEEKIQEYIEKVKSAETAVDAKSAGGKTAMKKEGVSLDIECWENKKDDIMDKLIRSKVERHEDIRKILETVKEQGFYLVHFSRMDMIWGAHVDAETGEVKKGENRLGKLYMSLL